MKTLTRISAFSAILLLTLTTAIAQPLGTDFRQWANDDLEWLNGILQQNNSTYYEGTSSLQRVGFVNIQGNIPSPDGWYELALAHEALKGNIHAYDFITGYDQACLDYIGITNDTLCPPDPSGNGIGPQIDAAFVLALYNGPNSILVQEPDPTVYGVNGSQDIASRVAAYDAAVGGSINRRIQMYGSAPIDSAKLVFTGYDNPGSQSNEAHYLLRWKSTSDSILILLGGHLAVSGDGEGVSYGEGRGSAAISGGPYHFKLFTLNGVSLGNQDNQIKGADLLTTPNDTCAVNGLETVCNGSLNEYSATTNAASPTYQWSVTGDGTIVGSDTSATVMIQADTIGSYTVSVDIFSTGINPGQTTCDLTVSVAPDPTCLISRSSGSGDLCPGDTASFCGPAGMADYEWSITGNGSISGSNTGQCVLVEAGSTCGADFTLSLTVTDANGCTSTCSESYSVNDTTAPAFTFVPSDFTAYCDQSPSFGTPTASDDCGTANLSSVDTTYGSCPSYLMRTWTATDACGNTATARQTITIMDTTAPNITGVGSDLLLDCPASLTFSSPQAQDDCEGANLSYVDDTLSASCPFTVKRTWTATDDCGNSSTATQTISIQDTTGPSFTFVPAGDTLACNATPLFGTPSASDECGSAALSSEDDTSAVGCLTIYTRTWTATDDCGNESSASQSLYVPTDDLDPSITGVGADATVSCPATISFSTPSANDNCLTPSLTFEDDTLNAACPFTVKRTWTATDACGNTTSSSQTISVQDTTAPVFNSTPADATIYCPNPFVFDNVTVGDACSSTNLSHEDDTLSASCPFTIKRTWTATDACGNSASISQTISQQDTTAPKFDNAPVDYTVQCPGALTFDNVSAKDECSSANITFEDDTLNASCPFTVKRTWTAEDACGNSSSISQTITQQDTTAPSFDSTPSDLTIYCPTSLSFGQMTATDACGTANVSYEDDTLNAACPLTVKRTWTAEDACGNSSSISQTITQQDTLAPVISGVGSDMTIDCPDDPSFSNPSPVDACSSASLSYEDDTVQSGCTYTYTRTWTATDACGNESMDSQVITVQDVTGPVFVGCEDLEFCVEDIIEFDLPTAYDECSDSVTLTHVRSDGLALTDTFPTGVTWIYSTAIDECGNTSTCSLRVYIDEFCSLCGLTQGFYGNTGGKYCGIPTSDLLYNLLDSALVIGYGPRSFTIFQTDVACLIQRLPGGRKATVLTDSATCSNPVGISLDKQGRVENNLLSQTITLGLNLRLSEDLCTYRLDSIGLHNKIMQYLGPNSTVCDLYALANDALSGAYVPSQGSPNLGHITGALGDVNDDSNYKCRCEYATYFSKTSFDTDFTMEEVERENIDIMVYPNPTQGNATIQFTLAENDERVSLQLYNTAGQLIYNLFEGTVDAGQTFKVNVPSAALPSGMYLYQIKTSKEAKIGKLMIFTKKL